MPPGFSGAKMERDGETTMLELKQTCLDDIIDDVDTKKVKWMPAEATKWVKDEYG